MYLTVDTSVSALLPRVSSLTALATASRPEVERLSTFILTTTSTVVPPKLGRYVSRARSNLPPPPSVKDYNNNNKSEDGGVRVISDSSLLELDDFNITNNAKFAIAVKRLRGPRRLLKGGNITPYYPLVGY